MTFTTQTQTLRQTLAAVAAVIPSKPAVQVLNNILVEAAQDSLTLTACNTEQTVTMSVKLTEPTATPVKFLVNARDINAIAKAANFDCVTFEIADPHTLNIGCGFSDYTLPILSTDEFPTQSLPTAPTTTLTMQSNDIRLALSRVAHAVGTDDLRPQMKGVYFDLTPTAFVAVASDTRVLAKSSTPYRTEQPTSAIIPTSAVSMLQGSFLTEPTVNVSLYNNSAVFECGGNRLTTVLINGRFPDYNRVIPQSSTYNAKFNRKDFNNAVNSVSAFADATSMARLEFAPTECVVSVRNLDYQQKATARCKCAFSGSEMTINFNLRYLQSVLKSIDSDEVLLKLTDPSRPGVFVSDGDESTLNLLMPMQG